MDTLEEFHSPICIDISPIAQVALLQTDINSGFKFVPSMGMKSAERRENQSTGRPNNCLLAHLAQKTTTTTKDIPMQGFTCWKQALVRSPSRAKELWRTSGILSWSRRKQQYLEHRILVHRFIKQRAWTALYLHTLIHKSEDVAASDQLLDGATQALRQSTQKIQSHNHEVFVRHLILIRLWLMKLNSGRKK